jgi:hypothetical protein
MWLSHSQGSSRLRSVVKRFSMRCAFLCSRRWRINAGRVRHTAVIYLLYVCATRLIAHAGKWERTRAITSGGRATSGMLTSPWKTGRGGESGPRVGICTDERLARGLEGRGRIDARREYSFSIAHTSNKNRRRIQCLANKLH